MKGSGSQEGCVFCSIARHASPARVVFEDELTMAFLDLFPLSRGHTLVIPKTHVDRLTDLPRSQYEAMLGSVTEVCRRIERLSGHYNVGINQGSLAGQIVFHLHFHVIPRYEDQPTYPRQRTSLDEGEADRVLRELRGG